MRPLPCPAKVPANLPPGYTVLYRVLSQRSHPTLSQALQTPPTMSVYLLATIMEDPGGYQLTMTSSERREEEIIMDPLHSESCCGFPPETCESVSEDDHGS